MKERSDGKGRKRIWATKTGERTAWIADYLAPGPDGEKRRIGFLFGRGCLGVPGLRASELRGLAWDAVDLEQRVLTVRQRADRWNTIGSPKSDAGKREVPLAPIVVNTLRESRLTYR